MPNAGYEKEIVGEEIEIKIAIVNFAFDNPEVIETLRKRGEAI